MVVRLEVFVCRKLLYSYIFCRVLIRLIASALFSKGYEMSDLMYAPPKASLEKDETDSRGPEFYVVSLKKFFILYLLTSGFFAIHWFYRNWSLNKKFSGSKVWPAARVIFAVIYAFPLFRTVDKSLRRQGRGHMAYWAISGLVLLALTIAGMVLSQGVAGHVQFKPVGGWLVWAVLLATAQTFNLMLVQSKMNAAALDPDGSTNSRLTWANGLWILAGCAIWLMSIPTYLSASAAA
ncbi:Membrane protein [Pseudomonas syringae pv. actinidiae]|uniref:Membrane protein n=2 Tax=Pseudomonas TaxID=286 RepID=A0A7Z6U5Y5_PSESF|nr:Membrane protein [Pseudomonas syringae pv. actinidiae]